MPSLIRKRDLTRHRLELLRAAHAAWVEADRAFERSFGKAQESAAASALDAQRRLVALMLAYGVADPEELTALVEEIP